MTAGPNAALKEAASAVEGVDPKHPAAGSSTIVDIDAGQIRLFNADGSPRTKIALCGFASSSRDMAPWTDPTWTIVGMNQLKRHIPRADVWFEIHKEWNTALVPGTDHAGWLRDCGIPVMMTDRVPGLPTSVRFPIERLIAKFGDYFTSTVAHMLAWAIDYIDDRVAEKMETASPGLALATASHIVDLQRSFYRGYEIGIYGVDLVVGEEYGWQRPCAEFYVGQALARDITVKIPSPSALLKQRYRYGYQMQPNDLITDVDFEKRRVFLVNNLQAAADQTRRFEGALEESKYWAELYALRERGASVG